MEGFDFCCIAWNRRTGWTPLVSSVVVSSFTHWQPRTVAIQGSQLMYFENGQEDGPPRGCIDLIKDQIQIQVIPPDATEKNAEDGPTPHQFHIKAFPHALNAKSNKTTSQSTSTTSTTKASHSIVWKFCFDQQSDLMTCLTQIHQVLEEAGQFATKSTERFEHEFQTADHIYRWEMIVVPPVIYPIQIHGIVLEAGRNCVVVADFGLTGYSKQQGKEFHHVSGDDSHSTTQAVLAAFKKLRPTQQDQRLHILTLIDPKEIRKWTKAGYDQDSFLNKHTIHHSKALEAVSSWFGKLRTTTKTNDKDDSHSSNTEDIYHGDQPVVRITSESSPKQSHFKTKQANQVLPQSDPPEIVLERAHYLLEHMNVLPPYHVFYSNSECIAVWCKTGRWSTLQTAVFLGSNSVGAAKSSTLATLGVAAANPLLAPVVALGGLVWITAPMYILKKSREQWQLITEYMTDIFWSAASSKAFVAAIQHWSGLVQKDEHGNIVAVEDAAVLRRRLHMQHMQVVKHENENGHDRDEGIDDPLPEEIQEHNDVTEEEMMMEDMHGPLAPPPMMAPPPPPPLDDGDQSDLNMPPSQVEENVTNKDETTTELDDATDLSPIESDQITAHDFDGVTEDEQYPDVTPSVVDDEDEPMEPPIDTLETPSTDYETKEEES